MEALSVSKSLKKALITFALPLVITLLVFEASLWVTPFINTRLTNKVSAYVNQDWPYTSQGWAYRYLKEPKSLQDSKLYEVHPTRGWVFKPNHSFWVDGYQWTINRYGHRSLTTPLPNTTPYTVFITGDSQTAGDEVDDIHVWPNQLQQLVPQATVVNAAVSGYSLSQMIITAIEEYDTWQPSVIVLAVIEDDLYRSALDFRTGPMPTISLEPFHIHPVTLKHKAEIRRSYFSKAGYHLRNLRSVRLAFAIKDRLFEFPKNVEKASQINQAMLARLTETVSDDTDIIFAYMPYPYELSGQAQNTMLGQYEQLCERFESNHFTCMHLGEQMLQDLSDFRQGGGHYHRKGNQMTANVIAEAIKQKPAMLALEDTN